MARLVLPILLAGLMQCPLFAQSDPTEPYARAFDDALGALRTEVEAARTRALARVVGKPLGHEPARTLQGPDIEPWFADVRRGMDDARAAVESRRAEHRQRTGTLEDFYGEVYRQTARIVPLTWDVVLRVAGSHRDGEAQTLLPEIKAFEETIRKEWDETRKALDGRRVRGELDERAWKAEIAKAARLFADREEKHYDHTARAYLSIHEFVREARYRLVRLAWRWVNRAEAKSKDSGDLHACGARELEASLRRHFDLGGDGGLDSFVSTGSTPDRVTLRTQHFEPPASPRYPAIERHGVMFFRLDTVGDPPAKDLRPPPGSAEPPKEFRIVALEIDHSGFEARRAALEQQAAAAEQRVRDEERTSGKGAHEIGKLREQIDARTRETSLTVADWRAAQRRAHGGPMDESLKTPEYRECERELALAERHQESRYQRILEVRSARAGKAERHEPCDLEDAELDLLIRQYDAEERICKEAREKLKAMEAAAGWPALVEQARAREAQLDDRVLALMKQDAHDRSDLSHAELVQGQIEARRLAAEDELNRVRQELAKLPRETPVITEAVVRPSSSAVGGEIYRARAWYPSEVLRGLDRAIPLLASVRDGLAERRKAALDAAKEAGERALASGRAYEKAILTSAALQLVVETGFFTYDVVKEGREKGFYGALGEAVKQWVENSIKQGDALGGWKLTEPTADEAWHPLAPEAPILDLLWRERTAEDTPRKLAVDAAATYVVNESAKAFVEKMAHAITPDSGALREDIFNVVRARWPSPPIGCCEYLNAILVREHAALSLENAARTALEQRESAVAGIRGSLGAALGRRLGSARKFAKDYAKDKAADLAKDWAKENLKSLIVEAFETELFRAMLQDQMSSALWYRVYLAQNHTYWLADDHHEANVQARAEVLRAYDPKTHLKTTVDRPFTAREELLIEVVDTYEGDLAQQRTVEAWLGDEPARRVGDHGLVFAVRADAWEEFRHDGKGGLTLRLRVR